MDVPQQGAARPGAEHPAGIRTAEAGPRAPAGFAEASADSGTGTGMRPRGLWAALATRRWPLLLVLAVQAALSLQLVWSNTAFQDEALYLWAGHLEVAHLLHHVPVPDFAAFFSGSPLTYPPIAAIADSLWGLAGARLLSLGFMLTATVMLHGMTRRLFSSRASAFFAAALFAGAGSVAYLGAFATYDAMALMLLALATWLGVRAGNCPTAARVALLSAAAAVLALANATKYASALFDPVVITVAALATWRLRGRAAGLAAGAVLAAVAVALLAAAYRLGGPSYAHGISFSTVSRAAGTGSALPILSLSARWAGITAALGVIGALVITHTWRSGPTTALAWTLAAAAFLAPAEQARIHVYVSLFKHVGYGAWFASAAAGYLLAALPRAVGARGRMAALRGCTIAVALAAALGFVVAAGQYGTWPDSRAMTAALRTRLRPGGQYLAEDSGVPAYYLIGSVRWQQWSNTFSFGYTDPASGRFLLNGPAYADAIRHRFFTVIVLSFGDTDATDQVIAGDIRRYGGYRLAAVVRFRTDVRGGAYKIWTLAKRRRRHGR